METGTIILTSTGLTNEVVREAIFKTLKEHEVKSVALIVTAAKGKAENKHVQHAYQGLRDGGIETVDLVDLETDTIDFSRYGCIYVAGGNTFTLLKAAREHGLKDAVTALLARDGVYVGVSAGSILLSPTIDVANEIDPDTNDAKLKDLTGLGLVPFHVVVHYEPRHEADIATFFTNHPDSEIVRLADDEAVLYAKHTLTMI